MCLDTFAYFYFSQCPINLVEWVGAGMIMSVDHLVENKLFRTSCNCGDSLPTNAEFTLEDLMTTYNPTGPPVNFKAVQSMGLINFEFSDHSYCSAGFQFTRAKCVDSDNSSLDPLLGCILR